MSDATSQRKEKSVLIVSGANQLVGFSPSQKLLKSVSSVETTFDRITHAREQKPGEQDAQPALIQLSQTHSRPFR